MLPSELAMIYGGDPLKAVGASDLPRFPASMTAAGGGSDGSAATDPTPPGGLGGKLGPAHRLQHAATALSTRPEEHDVHLAGRLQRPDHR